jgi:hypothetical protein
MNPSFLPVGLLLAVLSSGGSFILAQRSRVQHGTHPTG